MSLITEFFEILSCYIYDKILGGVLMDTYLRRLMEQYKSATGIKNVDANSKKFIKGFKEWLDEKIIQAHTFLVQKNEGMGTVEIILIIVVLVGLVIIFKDQITKIVQSIFSKITNQTNKI